jgi:hypothetical protein
MLRDEVLSAMAAQIEIAAGKAQYGGASFEHVARL